MLQDKLREVIVMILDESESLCLDNKRDKVVLFNKLYKAIWLAVCNNFPFEKKK